LKELKKDMLSVNNINTFIWRQKQYRKNVKLDLDNKRVIRINYEDLIYNYQDTVLSLFKKLSIEPSKHIYKLKSFNPQNSKQNLGLWKQNNKTAEILKIEDELKEYLYDN